MSSTLSTTPNLSTLIHQIRGHRVILDSDLARLYAVPTKALNQAVKRNHERFPEAFCFQITAKELNEISRMRSQTVTASKRNIRFLPNVFTEHGALMAANVLNSKRAVEVSVQIVMAFIHLRRMSLSVEALARKIIAMEKRYDEKFAVVFNAIRQLMAPPPEPKRRRIGFHTTDDE